MCSRHISTTVCFALYVCQKLEGDSKFFTRAHMNQKSLVFQSFKTEYVYMTRTECKNEVMQEVQDAWDDVMEKDTCTINLTGPEKDFWMGSEAGMLGCYWFRGVIFAGD